MIKAIPLILLIALLTCQHVAWSQKAFNYKKDFKKILAKTKDPKDKLFYDNLLKRFSSNDSTLTDYEVLALLIGYTDKPAYKPYADLTTERKIYNLNGDQKYKEALDSGYAFTRTHPFSVKVLYEMAYAYHKLDAADSVKYYAAKANKIFSAMYFSGNGKTPQTPTFALGPADGQDYILKYVLADIGTMGSGSDKNGNFLDILEVKFDDGRTMTLYFIIQHATEKMFSGEGIEEELKEKKKK